MPPRSLRPCKQIGCHQLTREANGYCVDHISIGREVKQQHNKHYDKSVRCSKDKQYTTFYHSDEWIKVRAIALRRDHGLCQHCLKDGMLSEVPLADMVHHIVEVKADWTLRLTLSNLISLCNTCHSKIPHNTR